MNKINQLGLGVIVSLAATSSVMAKEKTHKHKKEKVMEDDKEPWACVKNDKIIHVKGKNDRQKQDHCEAQFGIWEKKRHAVQETK